jgi:hypothetical protein
MKYGMYIYIYIYCICMYVCARVCTYICSEDIRKRKEGISNMRTVTQPPIQYVPGVLSPEVHVWI